MQSTAYYFTQTLALLVEVKHTLYFNSNYIGVLIFCLPRVASLHKDRIVIKVQPTCHASQQLDKGALEPVLLDDGPMTLLCLAQLCTNLESRPHLLEHSCAGLHLAEQQLNGTELAFELACFDKLQRLPQLVNALGIREELIGISQCAIQVIFKVCCLFGKHTDLPRRSLDPLSSQPECH